MDKIKIGLLGVILVLVAYNTVTLSGVTDKMKALETNVMTKLNNVKVATPAPAVVAPTTISNPATPPPVMPTTQAKPVGPSTNVKFDQDLHDFGSVSVDSENYYAFTFKNTGSEPLLISNAKGSCGCTVPQWPKEAVMPGETGTIDVKYTPNKGQAGQIIEKVVTITANTVPANTIVRIKAQVSEK